LVLKLLQSKHLTNKSRVPSANFVGLNILYREYSADIFYAVFHKIRDFFHTALLAPGSRLFWVVC